jgi:multiple antibiotic resistance protein
MAQFFSLFLRLFFVFTPFFGLSMFLTMTEGYSEARRRRLALSVAAATFVICMVLFFAGQQIFGVLGITLNSFRIGAGALLFLSAVGLVQAKAGAGQAQEEEDVAVVPLAIPVIVGPATTGTILVMGAELESSHQMGLGCLALLSAVVCMAGVLLLSSFLQRVLGLRGIVILSKLTGLVISAIAAQMVMTGILGFMAGGS